jgi:putative flippase GtrA
MQTYLKNNARRIALFVLIGIANSALDFLVLNLLSRAFGIQSWWAYPLWKSFSFACALFQSYYLNKRFTFADRPKSAFSLFIAVTMASFVLNIIISTLAYHVLMHVGVPEFWSLNLGALVGIGASMITNFIGYNYVVFKELAK